MSGINTSIQITDRISGSLNRITASLYGVTEAFHDVDVASDATFDNTSAVQSMTQEMYRYEQRIQQLENDLVDANNRLEQMEEQTKAAANAARTLKSAFGAVSGIIAALGVKEVVEMSDSLVQTTSRLNMMNDGMQTTDELVQMVYASSQDARGEFNAMADVVARFGNNAKDAFSSSEEVVAFSNLIQKYMTVAGASTSEAANAMLQLSQGLGSGTLRGDELNSIFEQAPNLIQAIADYLDVPIGQIRNMASEGQLTADIVKAAIFASADDINAKFAEMPMTWGQVATSMKNTAIMAFQPVLQQINDIANGEQFQSMMDGITNIMYKIGNVAAKVFGFVASIGAFVAEHWSIIAPIMWGVVTALTAYTVALGIHKAIQVVSGIIKAIATVIEVAHAKAVLANVAAYDAETVATAKATVAQAGFNTTLLACPITWIILAIIALIAVVYLVVAAINKVTGSTISATGIIFGAVATVGAAIWNIIVGLVNGIIQFVWAFFVAPFIGIIEWILNVCNGGFDSFGGAVANLVGQIISWFLSLGQVVTKIIDAIFGTNWTAGLQSLQNKVVAWGKNENAITLSAEAPDIGGSRIAYGDAWNAGYSLGEGIEDKVSGLFGGSAFDMSSFDIDSAYTDTGAGSLADAANATASNTSDNLDISNEQLKYLRDIAERDAINKFTTAEIKVDMTNNNNISSGVDLDGIITSLSDGLREAMEVAAEGV